MSTDQRDLSSVKPMKTPFLDHGSFEWKSKTKVEQQLYYQSLFENLTPLQKRAYNQHANDLEIRSKTKVSKLENSKAFIKSASTLLLRNYLVICGNPTAPITRPLNTAYVVVWFGVVYSAIFVMMVLFFWARVFQVDKIITFLSGAYCREYTLINWLDITLFDLKKSLIDAAKPALESELVDYTLKNDHKNQEDVPIPSRKRLEFNLDVARATLLMCAIVYERDAPCVRKASDNHALHHNQNWAIQALMESEEKVLRRAHEWGLGYIPISDFQTMHGSYAGVFYSMDNTESPYMILVMKGTSPDEYIECLTDCACKFEACGDYLGQGKAHEGFYEALFPEKSDADQVSPYERIITYLKMIAQSIRYQHGKRVNLIIGGHSLGAGVASILYARLLESPSDLGPDILLRDAYTFGTPRACDAKLADRVDHNLNKKKNQGRHLWRIANHDKSSFIGDIVTHVPPGVADSREARGAMQDGSYFAYAAIGIRVDLKPPQSIHKPRCPPKISFIPVGYSVDVKGKVYPYQPKEKSPGLPNIVELSMKVVGLLGPILHDHFPASYMNSLNKMVITDKQSVHTLG